MVSGTGRVTPAWLCRLVPVCLLMGGLLAAGCAGGRKTADPALAQAARELAAGMDVAAVPGTGILSHDSEERQVPPRVQRLTPVSHGVAGLRDVAAASGAPQAAGDAASVGSAALAATPAMPTDPAAHEASGVSDVWRALPGGPRTVSLSALPSLEPAPSQPLPALRPVPALWRRLALEAQEIFGLDAALVLAVIRAESSFNAMAVSSAGAEGAMQIMPRTQEELGLIDPFDPRANVYAGAQYLLEQLHRFGSVELALAAYNAGPASVERYGGIPPYPETQEYVRRVLAYWEAEPGRSREALVGRSVNSTGSLPEPPAAQTR